jgi:hypothetical protein
MLCGGGNGYKETKRVNVNITLALVSLVRGLGYGLRTRYGSRPHLS